MTDIEKEELKSLRKDELRIKEIVHNMENESDDVDFAIRNLEKWKSGRGFGFIFLSIICIILFLFMLPYTQLFQASYETRMEVKADMVTEAISATAMIFGFLLFSLLSILDIIFAIKYFMEMGKSGLAQNMAFKFGHKNYYNSMQALSQRKITIQKELFEIKSELNQIKERLKILEELEYSS